MLRYSFAMSLCAGLLAGCQPSTTYSPSVSQDELQQEQQVQMALAHEKELKARHKKRQRKLDMEVRLHKVATKIEPYAAELCREIHSDDPTRCVFTVELGEKEDVNAFADGKKVTILSGMMSFAKKDEELAYVLSHELAHNIMRHADAGRANAVVGSVLGVMLDVAAASVGVPTAGSFSKLGAQAAKFSYSKDYEREADYVGMYILARSGYDLKDAPTFWRRMSEKKVDGIYIGTTHPTNPERYVAMNKTIAEIEAKQAQGVPLLPEAKQYAMHANNHTVSSPNKRKKTIAVQKTAILPNVEPTDDSLVAAVDTPLLSKQDEYAGPFAGGSSW